MQSGEVICANSQHGLIVVFDLYDGFVRVRRSHLKTEQIAACIITIVIVGDYLGFRCCAGSPATLAPRSQTRALGRRWLHFIVHVLLPVVVVVVVAGGVVIAVVAFR